MTFDNSSSIIIMFIRQITEAILCSKIYNDLYLAFADEVKR